MMPIDPTFLAIAFAVALYGIPFVAAWTADELSIPGYAVRIFGVFVSGLGIAFLASATWVELIVLCLIPWFLLFRWSAMRINAAGWSKWVLLVWILPPLGLIYTMKLLVAPDRYAPAGPDPYR